MATNEYHSTTGANGSSDTTNGPKVTVPLWINGKEESGSSTFDVMSPYTGEVCWKAAAASKQDTIRATEVAQRAFLSWSKTKLSTRRDLLMKAADIMDSRVEEYREIMQTEMGADEGMSGFLVPSSIAMLRELADWTMTICGRSPVCQDDGRSAIVFKEPYGVILGIVPWNAPWMFGIRSAATAIATGNTTILKTSELSPRCFWAIGKAFAEAGCPPGVLNILSCPPTDAREIVNTMIEHPFVRKINFTGSAHVGRMVASTCGQNLKPCLMELGGKNSSIILPDADLQKAAFQCVLGFSLNSGQICMSTDRILVHSSIASEFFLILKATLDNMYSSKPPPTIISNASKTRIEKLVSEAVSSGASVIYRGKNDAPGSRLGPIVVGDMRESMKMWQDEVFGNAVGCMTFNTDDEAIEIANRGGYGLSGAIFTKDLRRALALAKRIESGAIHINSMTPHDEPILPFGGVKDSGWGRFNGPDGLDEFLVTKTVTWDD